MEQKSDSEKKETSIKYIKEIQKFQYSFSKGRINLKMQIVSPNMIPFSDFVFEYDRVFIKFLYGENIKLGDLYCQCKLLNDLKWEKTKK